MVFDFDPDEGLGFDAVKEAALGLREVLTSVGLQSFPMASGGKGLHVVVPLDGSQSFDDLGDFAGGIARGLAKADPKRYVAVASKEKRRGRIFVDWLRNRPYATAVLPWSLRARPPPRWRSRLPGTRCRISKRRTPSASLKQPRGRIRGPISGPCPSGSIPRPSPS